MFEQRCCHWPLQVPCWCILHIARLDAYNIRILEFFHVEKYLYFFAIPKAWTIYDIAFSTCANKIISFSTWHMNLCAVCCSNEWIQKKKCLLDCVYAGDWMKYVLFFTRWRRVSQMNANILNAFHKAICSDRTRHMEKGRKKEIIQRDPNENNGSHSNIE